ncbi:hypothetical protein ASC71_01645 [Rhizobium sp. Root1240]|uniref:GGDEF domain-containing protein n=1 Tax=unclassified Rhizobium TaxID=2613769 RepID=UPI000713CAC9|nr:MULTISPECIES: GGDEF domain-containing protein [unclassified Rhizobium]KQW31024.1 hypothetical protein ASC71_01645 [Rhizobium sp. Root1240]
MDTSLHLPTIMVVHALITTISTLVTIYMWKRSRCGPVMPLLVAAGVAACLTMGLHAGRHSLPLFLSSCIGLGLGVLAVGLYWQAVMAFEGERVSLPKAAAGMVAWMMLWFTPLFQQSMEVKTSVLGILVATYCLLAAGKMFARAKKEPLPSRHLAAITNAVRGIVWLTSVPLCIFVAPAYAADGSPAPWFAYVVLANSMMIVLSLVALLMLSKERDELRYRVASERDPLTNLANRRTFVSGASRILLQEEGASLLLLDIDHFKLVNDTHGHAAGDQVLVAFSRTIEQRLPKGWLFARIGGEEFACLMPRTNAQTAVALADNLRRAVAEIVIASHPGLKVTVSIGVSEASERGTALDPLLASADSALYRAKADGRNCVRLFEPAALLADTAGKLALIANEPPPKANRRRLRSA